MKKQIILIALVLSISLVVRAAKAHLAGTESLTLTAWPSQVIFGFYFTILTLAIQALLQLRERAGRDFRRQALLLLMLIGVCLDLVLVNVQEVIGHVDASYGPIVIWDVATFFIWLRVIDLCRPRNHLKFSISWPVMVAPLFGLGREILFLPYQSASAGLAYLDLLFGHLLISLWVFFPFIRQSRTYELNRGEGGAERILVLLIFTGCAYWLVSALENTVELAWAPYNPSLKRMFQHMGVSILVLNCLQFVVAVWITLTLWYWDFFGIGSRFGISRKRSSTATL